MFSYWKYDQNLKNDLLMLTAHYYLFLHIPLFEKVLLPNSITYLQHFLQHSMKRTIEKY